MTLEEQVTMLRAALQTAVVSVHSDDLHKITAALAATAEPACSPTCCYAKDIHSYEHSASCPRATAEPATSFTVHPDGAVYAANPAMPAPHHAGHSECVIDGDSRCVDTAEPATHDPACYSQPYPLGRGGECSCKFAPTYSADDLRKVAEAAWNLGYAANEPENYNTDGYADTKARDLNAIIAKAVGR